MSLLAITYLSSPLGVLEIQGDERGITSILYENHIVSRYEATPETELPDFLLEARKQLQAYFEGKRREFDLPFSLSGTPFQKEVWQALLQIPYGKTESYMRVAQWLGDEKVIRASSSAIGKNPVSIVIPCHRVLGSRGDLTGYGGELWRKAWLLEHESPFKQGKLFE